MLKNHYLAKSISDVAWNQFAQQLFFKAEDAGRKIVAVDPRYTSQRCSQCGTIVQKVLLLHVGINALSVMFVFIEIIMPR